MTQKKFVDIARVKESYATVFAVGENITLTEKVDGANASFTYDADTDGVVSFSRKNILNESNTLQGWFNVASLFPVDTVKKVTAGGRYVVFGEWLVKHTIAYPDACYKKFYMYDVWDTVDECYLPHTTVVSMYNDLKNGDVNIEFVNVFYVGPFISWEHVHSFVGQSAYGASPCGEGVVIKSQDRLRDADNSKRPRYLKVVAEKFSEVHQDHKKPVDPEALKKKEAERDFVASIATDRRIDKCLEKLVDEGVIPVDWDEKDMKTIAKNLPSAVYADCVKEENESVVKCENFGKVCGTLTMARVRSLLQTR